MAQNTNSKGRMLSLYIEILDCKYIQEEIINIINNKIIIIIVKLDLHRYINE